ncbi:class I SAM-dependent DNA methyltransferase [Ramlibacter sp.]|uniref:class I SAM-dependent DNA methyltransferase n=1 Tax=Ramlibacter sp. TaxID=1917967 RepID=UPI002BFEC8A7|nr:tetratricopeptide repeat protein [Ramlibacter sp.]HWI81786.1 tetratricopeptide repeat protein [Ramlibacter sp.]
MTGNFEQARDFFLKGVAHYRAGDFAQAEREFAAALDLVPGRVSTLTNLGAARLKLGRIEEAVALLDEALAQEPDNVEALRQRAAALAELGRHAAALAAIDRALALQPANGPAWTLRGSILRALGRLPEAADAYRSAARHGDDSELSRFFLASLAGGDTPPAAPREYVQSLFDGYAHEFDQHLVDVLHYRAPEILVRGLGAQPVGAALDLGCGTGLCGRLLRPLCRRLDGVDLSARMAQRSAATGWYDEVVQADAADYLHGTDRRYALVVAADVFIYVGALERVFAGAARVLARGGRLCCCVELAPPGADLVLQPSLRYAHSAGYIHKLAQQAGFEISATAEHPIREDQGLPIPGLFAWLIRT